MLFYIARHLCRVVALAIGITLMVAITIIILAVILPVRP
jgi:hypothetical protein